MIATLDDQIRTYDRQIEELAEGALPGDGAPAPGAGVGASPPSPTSLPWRTRPAFPIPGRSARIWACVPARPIPGICRSATAHHQGRRRDAPASPRGRGPLHPRTLRPGHGSSGAGGWAWPSGEAKRGKRLALVAVARKLSVLLLRLWATGEAYEPLRNSARRGQLAPLLRREAMPPRLQKDGVAEQTRSIRAEGRSRGRRKPIPGDCAFSLGQSDISLDSGTSPICSLQRRGPSGPNVHRVSRDSRESANGSVAAGCAEGAK